MPLQDNLLSDLPPTSGEAEEIFTPILDRPGVRLERIVSTGQASPPGFWYDQAWDEWVLLVEGWALLRVGTEETPRRLGPGDHLLIPARCRHRVEATAPDRPTVWLALHLDGERAGCIQMEPAPGDA